MTLTVLGEHFEAGAGQGLGFGWWFTSMRLECDICGNSLECEETELAVEAPMAGWTKAGERDICRECREGMLAVGE